MDCPYTKKECDGVDTSGMTKIECKDCWVLKLKEIDDDMAKTRNE